MRATRLFALAVLAIGTAVQAQDPQPEPYPERLYLNPGILIGSNRMIGLGGAYTGMAEGAEGVAANFASIGHRTPTENPPYQISPFFTFNYNFGEYDFDNDGVNDQARVSAQYLGGLQARVKYLGIGAFVRTNQLSFCPAGGCNYVVPDSQRLDVFLWNPTLAVSYAFLDESVIAAAGLHGTFGTITNGFKVWNYRGVMPAGGVLVRPRGMPFRVGVDLRPPITGGYDGLNAETQVLGRTLYSGIASPGVYSFGVAFKVGEGAFGFNDLPPIDAPKPSRALDARNPFTDMFRNRDDPKTGRLLIAAQVDIITPVNGAVPIGAFVGTQEPIAIGDRLMYTPRVGAEYAVVPGRFRARLGSYLEPSPYPNNSGRLHVTGGTELFLIRLIDDWAATATFDVADKYTNIGVSLSAWR